ncbi:hypothetical protein ACU4GD_38890 [Cupriavidus basilensis]
MTSAAVAPPPADAQARPAHAPAAQPESAGTLDTGVLETGEAIAVLAEEPQTVAVLTPEDVAMPVSGLAATVPGEIPRARQTACERREARRCAIRDAGRDPPGSRGADGGAESTGWWPSAGVGCRAGAVAAGGCGRGGAGGIRAIAGCRHRCLRRGANRRGEQSGGHRSGLGRCRGTVRRVA